MKGALYENSKKLTREWHPVKNAPLTPKVVSAGSSKKVWWRCSKGHEWQAVVCNRGNGAGCPYCTGRKACKDNSLATLRPLFASEWHPDRNAPLTPEDVTPGSPRNVWWHCSAGHEWQDSVLHRSHGRGCPFCSRRKVSREYSLLTISPAVARQWHPAKNAPLTPETVMAGSARKVWWICRKGHEWQARISHRSNGAGCPYCSGHRATKERCLAVVNRQLASQWHSTKNRPLTPKDVTPSSHRKVWWCCKKGHEWEAKISNRSLSKSCPYCSGRKATKENCLETLRPNLAKEWHPNMNGPLTPQNVTWRSTRTVWWRCRKGHEWQEEIGYRAKGRACPVCVLKAKANK